MTRYNDNGKRKLVASQESTLTVAVDRSKSGVVGGGRRSARGSGVGVTRARHSTSSSPGRVSSQARHRAAGGIYTQGIQVAGDMVFVQSDYAMFGQMPGNVLLAFRLPGD